jgi:hypothetical protein
MTYVLHSLWRNTIARYCPCALKKFSRLVDYGVDLEEYISGKMARQPTGYPFDVAVLAGDVAILAGDVAILAAFLGRYRRGGGSSFEAVPRRRWAGDIP